MLFLSAFNSKSPYKSHRPFDRNNPRGLFFIIMPDKWIELIVTGDILEAEMIKDILESGGIQVIIESAKVSPYPVNIGKMGEVRVMIRETDKDTATEVLEKFPDKDDNSKGQD